MIGKTLLHYEILEKLGEGGMGEVYRARDTKLGRDVAVKILPEEMSRNPERRARFEREARVIAALNHPNIVTIHSVEEFEDRLFLTMELVRGRTLRDAITEEGMSLGSFFSIAVPLLDAVCSAHAQGITHRDLKPANVMLSEEGRLKVLDFGLAKLFLEAEGAEQAKTVSLDVDTQEGHVLGTVSYMSPEQVEGKPLDARSDIFSLGVVFYEMLTGRRPFKGDSNASTISAILRDTPPPVTEIRASLPNHLGRIVRRCLAKDRNRRYQSAVEIRNDMQDFAEEIDSGEIVVNSGVAGEFGAGSPGGTNEAGAGSTAGDSGLRLAPSAEDSKSRQEPLSSDSVVLPGTKRMYRWIVGAFGLLAVVAVVAILINSRTTGEEDGASSTLTENPTLGVMGFENLSDPEDSENLDRVLMGLVTTGLAESGGLNVASTAKVLAARRQVGDGDRVFDASMAPEAARSAGADVMLVGQVVRDSDRMILTAELVDVRSGNALGSLKKEAASSSELIQLAGAIAREVRGLMGVSETDASQEDGFDLAESLTESPEAYRQFAAGEIAVHQGHYDQAAERFQQAIRIDPSFALAYLRLLLAYTWNGETDRGLAVAKQGLQYIDRLPERWQIVYRAHIYYYEGDPDRVYQDLLPLVDSSTDIADAYNLLGEVATHFSKYRNSRLARDCFERVLEIDPTFEVVFFHLVWEYIQFDDRRALEDLIERYRARDPTDPRVMDAELMLWQAQQRYEQVISRLEDQLREGDFTRWDDLAFCHEAIGNWERAYELSRDAVERREKGYNHAFALYRRASAQIGRGNIAAGMEDIDAACERLESMGQAGRWSNTIVSGYRWTQAHVLLETGDIEEAIEAAERATRIDPPDTWSRLALIRIQVRAGDTAGAEKTFRELEQVREGNLNPQDELVAALAEAELRRAQGDIDAALAALRRARAMPVELQNPLTMSWIEGGIHSAAGDHESASASYRWVFESSSRLIPDIMGGLTAFVIPLHYVLAQSEEKSGRLAEAKRHYEAYLERWGNADIEIPNVAIARERLRALEERL